MIHSPTTCNPVQVWGIHRGLDTTRGDQDFGDENYGPSIACYLYLDKDMQNQLFVDMQNQLFVAQKTRYEKKFIPDVPKFIVHYDPDSMFFTPLHI